jgi:hypothetical protein
MVMTKPYRSPGKQKAYVDTLKKQGYSNEAFTAYD